MRLIQIVPVFFILLSASTAFGDTPMQVAQSYVYDDITTESFDSTSTPLKSANPSQGPTSTQSTIPNPAPSQPAPSTAPDYAPPSPAPGVSSNAGDAAGYSPVQAQKAPPAQPEAPVAPPVPSGPAIGIGTAPAMGAGMDGGVNGLPHVRFKKTISILDFEDQHVGGHYGHLGTGMSAQLADALIHSNQFIVLERENLAGVLHEQDLANSGRATVSRTARIGRIIPSQIVIKGSITEYEEQTSGSGDSGSVNFGSLFGVPGVPSVGGSQQHSEAHVGMILRIIDSSSGEVIHSQRVERKIKSDSESMRVRMRGVSFGHKDFHKTPLGKAVHFTIRDAVRIISERLAKTPFSAYVIKAKGEKVFINVGKRHNVKVGDVFKVHSLGEELIDPVTGENLGGEKTEIGTLRVVRVQKKFSIATSEQADEINPGDLITE